MSLKHENFDQNHRSLWVQGQAISPRLGITLQADRSLLYELLFLEKEKYSDSTSHKYELKNTN